MLDPSTAIFLVVTAYQMLDQAVKEKNEKKITKFSQQIQRLQDQHDVRDSDLTRELSNRGIRIDKLRDALQYTVPGSTASKLKDKVESQYSSDVTKINNQMADNLRTVTQQKDALSTLSSKYQNRGLVQTILGD